jgi:hypothetical protein
MRWLLLAYPRDYRRDELLDTLAETGWPARRVAANLIRHGLRARLGRPASRSVVVWAALAAVACGLFSAALGTRAAWETSPPPPTPAEAAAILAEVLPDTHLDPNIEPATATWVVYTRPLSLDNVHDLLFGDGGEYQQSTVGSGSYGPGPTDIAPTVAGVARQMRAHGWRVYPLLADGAPCSGGCQPRYDVTVIGRRGDTILDVDVMLGSTSTTTFIAAEARRATPAAVWPAGIAAGLLGSLLAWLVFGWASRRTETRRRQIPVVLLYGIAMFLWWLPIAISLPLAAAFEFTTDEPQWDPLWEWLGQPTFSLPFLVGAACVLMGLTVAAFPHRRTVPEPTAAAG